jgi:transposase
VLPKLLAELRVERLGLGRPRTTPEALRGDKAYSSRGHRQLLRSRGIVAVIPEPADQAGHRKRKGSAGGRPVSYDTEDYKSRNVVERFFNRMKNWRGLASRYDKYALVYREASSSPRSSTGSDDCETRPSTEHLAPSSAVVLVVLTRQPKIRPEKTSATNAT